MNKIWVEKSNDNAFDETKISNRIYIDCNKCNFKPMKGITQSQNVLTDINKKG
jgi:hypothetical protein